MADDGDGEVWALELVLVLLLVRVVVLVVVLVPVLVLLLLLLRRRTSVLLYVTGTGIRGGVASSSSTISFQSSVLCWRVDWWEFSSSSMLSLSSSILGDPVTNIVGFWAGGLVSSIMERMPLVQRLREASRVSLHSCSSSNSIASAMGVVLVGGGDPGG